LVLRELDERIALAQQTVDSRTETLRIFSRRVAVGATSRLNQTQVETLLTQAQALLTQLQQARDAQAHGLALLVGKPIDLPPVA
ncbi:RND transporter, partial [Acinetobacter baumannii]